MKTVFEKEADKNKLKSEYGYALMWLAVSIMIGILPFYTNNSHFIYIILGILTLITACYKLYSAIRLSQRSR